MMRWFYLPLALVSFSCGEAALASDGDLDSTDNEATQSAEMGQDPSTPGEDDGQAETPETEPATQRPGEFACSTVRREVLGLVDTMSSGEVVVVEQQGDDRILYVDASAGGFQGAATSPFTYVNLEQGRRVDVTDFEADTSMDWDLAFKRFTIRTNSGDSGQGEGGAVGLTGGYDGLDTSSADRFDTIPDNFIDDATCEPTAGSADAGGGVPFAGWYNYEDATMSISPAEGVYLVRGADGDSLYRLEILGYYGTPNGNVGRVSGRYLFRYSEL